MAEKSFFEKKDFEKNRDIRREIVKRKAIKVGIVTFGSASIVGFIISLYMLIEGLIYSANNPNVAKIQEGYIYGFIIIIIISLIGSYISLRIYSKVKVPS